MNLKREPMTPKRRYLAGVLGGRVDAIPAGSPTSVATVECMEISGAFFPQVHTDGRAMATLAATAHTVLGFDAIMPIFSVQQEAAALGCVMDWGDRTSMPVERSHPFVQPEDVVIPPDFLDRPSIKAVLEALSILRHEYGHRVAIVGKVMGPWTLSYNTNGVQQFLMDTILEPDKVRRFLDRLKDVTLLFAKAQIAAGADVICLADHATGDLVSAKTYRDFLMPVHQGILKELGCPTILHICGDTTNRLSYLVEAGFDCFHFDSKVDAKVARSIVAGKMSLVGNVNNPQTLLRGTPEDARRETLYALEAGVEIAAPECAVPLITPNANLQAIVSAAKEFSERKRAAQGPAPA
jgi:[methyl-Co(III) methanol-specific corrinoid protein]:coenzyme M methyltransferase